jgi:hypothetical protein
MKFKKKNVGDLAPPKDTYQQMDSKNSVKPVACGVRPLAT